MDPEVPQTTQGHNSQNSLLTLARSSINIGHTDTCDFFVLFLVGKMYIIDQNNVKIEQIEQC